MTKEIKPHNRREIGEWLSKDVESYWCYLYIGGSYNIAEKECGKACFPSGLCVTIENIKYIFGGGSEEGVRVGFIQYPPFPESEKIIYEKAVLLGKNIAIESSQFSFSIVSNKTITFYSRVKK